MVDVSGRSTAVADLPHQPALGPLFPARTVQTPVTQGAQRRTPERAPAHLAGTVLSLPCSLMVSVRDYNVWRIEEHEAGEPSVATWR